MGIQGRPGATPGRHSGQLRTYGGSKYPPKSHSRRRDLAQSASFRDMERARVVGRGPVNFGLHPLTDLGRLRTVEILPPNIDPRMIDATGNQVEEVNRDWCEADAPAVNN